MKKPAIVSKVTVTAAFSHIHDGISLQDMDVSKDVRDRVSRVVHVRKRCLQHPELVPFVLFKELVAGRYNNASEEWHAAKKDEALYEIIKDEF